MGRIARTPRGSASCARTANTRRQSPRDVNPVRALPVCCLFVCARSSLIQSSFKCGWSLLGNREANALCCLLTHISLFQTSGAMPAELTPVRRPSAGTARLGSTGRAGQDGRPLETRILMEELHTMRWSTIPGGTSNAISVQWLKCRRAVRLTVRRLAR